MAGPSHKKRSIDSRTKRPFKKQKRQQQYHSDSEEEDNEGSFAAVDLLDSDDDILNAEVDDAESEHEASGSSEDENSSPKRKVTLKSEPSNSKAKSREPDSDQEEEEHDEDDLASEDENDDDQDSEGVTGKNKSKRNDPGAFATSLSKILSTKLSASKRADPVLARSAAAHEANKAAVDAALESKVRRQLRDQKRRALEKGRVKDVLLATNSGFMGEPEVSAGEVLVTERRLRKTAQRGVVKLFNAVRAAQVKAQDAEKGARRDGMLGMQNREDKVNELSKKGFLELIASGGGGLSKAPIEEA